MQEAMPDFHFNEAMYSRLNLMQTIPFPSKLGLKKHIAELELVPCPSRSPGKNEWGHQKNPKIAYDELWLSQQTEFWNTQK